MMSVIPFDNGTFLVSSRSRPGMQHLVDLCWQDSPKDKPRPACFCEAFAANEKTKGQPCAHILAAVDYEIKRLGL